MLVTGVTLIDFFNSRNSSLAAILGNMTDLGNMSDNHS